MITASLAGTCGTERLKPPGPVVKGIRILDLAGNEHPGQWDGLIDTGADRTAVPLSACEDMKLKARRWRRARGFDPLAPPRFLPVYYVVLRVEGIGELPVLAYGVERPHVLIGRDLLCSLVLAFDNPGSRWQAGRPTSWTRPGPRFLALR